MGPKKTYKKLRIKCIESYRQNFLKKSFRGQDMYHIYEFQEKVLKSVPKRYPVLIIEFSFDVIFEKISNQ